MSEISYVTSALFSGGYVCNSPLVFFHLIITIPLPPLLPPAPPPPPVLSSPLVPDLAGTFCGVLSLTCPFPPTPLPPVGSTPEDVHD